MVQKKKILLFFYFFITPIIIVFFLELLLSIYFKSFKIPTENRFKFRYMLYSNDSDSKLFDEYKNFFKYKPNLLSRHLLYYYEENNFLEIWDYKFNTNNFGLVQKSDIFSDQESILFLGDSFTQGQGASPWVDNFNGKIFGYQVINGGIIGTGFQQFENIYDHISKNFKIKKLVVIYIGGDLRRDITIVSDKKILFIPKSKKELNNLLLNQHRLRLNKKEKFKDRLKFFIRDLYVYNILRTRINSFRLKNDQIIKRNFNSIESLYKKNYPNIIFINVKTANEIITGQESYETKLINKFLKDKQYPNYKCDLSNDLTNYHKIDFHPNEKGYNELYRCVKKIIQNNLIKN